MKRIAEAFGRIQTIRHIKAYGVIVVAVMLIVPLGMMVSNRTPAIEVVVDGRVMGYTRSTVEARKALNTAKHQMNGPDGELTLIDTEIEFRTTDDKYKKSNTEDELAEKMAVVLEEKMSETKQLAYTVKINDFLVTLDSREAVEEVLEQAQAKYNKADDFAVELVADPSKETGSLTTSIIKAAKIEKQQNIGMAETDSREAEAVAETNAQAADMNPSASANSKEAGTKDDGAKAISQNEGNTSSEDKGTAKDTADSARKAKSEDAKNSKEKADSKENGTSKTESAAKETKASKASKTKSTAKEAKASKTELATKGTKASKASKAQSAAKETKESKASKAKSAAKETKTSKTESTAKETKAFKTESTAKETKTSKTESTAKETKTSKTESTAKKTKASKTKSAAKETKTSKAKSAAKKSASSKKAAEDKVIKVGFAEDIQIQETYVEPDKVSSVEEAVSDITKDKAANETYVVKSGDTISTIANGHGLTVKEFLKLNKGLKENIAIYPDDEVIITVPKPELTVLVQKEEQSTEKYSAEVKYVDNDDMYEGETKVKRKGKQGIRAITALVNYSNGEEDGREIVSEEIVKEAVAKVVERGTKVRPTFIKPLSGGTFTSGFKFRWGREHKGLDWATPVGTSVFASSSGTVSYAGWMNGYGNCIMINHGDGRQTRYAHLSEVQVSVGQTVTQGDKIALSGNTGRSTGPHVHFEILINGTQVNPFDYL